MARLMNKLLDYIWGPIEAPTADVTREQRQGAISRTVVDTPEGVPGTLDEAKNHLAQARMMGSANIFALNRERTALEALVSELRK